MNCDNQQNVVELHYTTDRVAFALHAELGTQMIQSSFGRIATLISAGASCCLISCGWVSDATAQVASRRERPAIAQALTVCLDITDVSARVACYDKAVTAFNQAEDRGRIVVVDQEQARAARKRAFGSTPLTSSKAAPDEPLDKVQVELTGASQNGDGKWVMVTTEGAVWRQTDVALLNNIPHMGSKLFVTKGFLGGFFCSIDKQPVIRCLRQ